MAEYYIDGRSVTREECEAQLEANRRAWQAGSRRVPVVSAVDAPLPEREILRRASESVRLFDPAPPRPPSCKMLGGNCGAVCAAPYCGPGYRIVDTDYWRRRVPAKYERLEHWWESQVLEIQHAMTSPARPAGGWSDSGPV